MQIISAVMISLLLHMPYFFQYLIVPGFCPNPENDIENDKAAKALPRDCFTHVDRFQQMHLWKLYGFIYQVGHDKHIIFKKFFEHLGKI